MSDYDVIILGGGAAGLMCAIAAGRRGRRVIVLESSNKIGKKILMSGGGRCNFTNLHSDESRFVSANPKFCVSALSRYTQWDFIALVEKHGIAYHEKTDGQLFCDLSSKEILDMLVDECRESNVAIQTHCNIDSVQKSERFKITYDGNTIKSNSLVVATGGLSIPKMGASDFGYRLARQFGLQIRETHAALVPFTFSGEMHAMTGRLAGVSCRATLATPSKTFTDDILFTHRGLSGPAALQASSYWAPGDRIHVNLLPDHDATRLLLTAKNTHPKSLLRSVISENLPRALVLELQQLLWPELADKLLVEIPDRALQTLAQHFQEWPLKPAGTEGYRTAEVTLGGVDTDELSSKTMQCRRQPGLYFIGEVVDVTGHLGGFNFQWAWSSGQAAGRVV